MTADGRLQFNPTIGCGVTGFVVDERTALVAFPAVDRIMPLCRTTAMALRAVGIVANESFRALEHTFV